MKRYKPTIDNRSPFYGEAAMIKSEYGNYVKYEDVMKLVNNVKTVCKDAVKRWDTDIVALNIVMEVVNKIKTKVE